MAPAPVLRRLAALSVILVALVTRRAAIAIAMAVSTISGASIALSAVISTVVSAVRTISSATITLAIFALLLGLAAVLPIPATGLPLVGLRLLITPDFLGLGSLSTLLVLLGLVCPCILVSPLSSRRTRAEIDRLLRLRSPAPSAKLAGPRNHVCRHKHEGSRESAAVMACDALGLSLRGRVGPEREPGCLPGSTEAPVPRRRGRRSGGGSLRGPLSASSAYTPAGRGGGRCCSRRTANRGSRGGPTPTKKSGKRPGY